MKDQHDSNAETIWFQVDGMVCHGCEQALSLLMRQHEGVATASADAKEGRLTVSLDRPVERSELIARIESAGFHVRESGSA